MFIVLNLETTKELAEIIYCQLAPLGFDALMENEKGDWITSIEEVNYSEKDTREILYFYENQNLLSYSITREKKQNWNQKWEKSFNPIRLDTEGQKKCIIRADFHPSEKSYEHELIITPKMSFGTGHHQTTRLMLSQQFSINHKNKTVLDAGSGTGVLAILAAKLGAKEVYACDIEDWSVENVLENAEKNSVSLISKHGTAETFKGQKFDILLANINKNVLLNEMPLYADLLNDKGILVLSGFHVPDIPDLEKRASKFGLHLEKQSQELPWASLKMIKT